MWPLPSRKPQQIQQPSPEHLDKLSRRSNIILDENRSLNPEQQASGGITFDFQVIEDEKILALFEPNSPLFCPLVLPILPLISRLNYLSNCSEKEARSFKLTVDIQIARLKNRASCVEEYQLLDSLRVWLRMRINDSVNGFKIRVLAERKKIIELQERETGAKKKKWGLFG